MTDFALSSGVSGAPVDLPQFPPVKPRWLTPTTTALVILAHLGLGAFLLTKTVEEAAPLDSISLDIMPEGDMFEQEEVDATEQQPDVIVEPDLAIPLPEVMTPDSPPIPTKQEHVEPKKQIAKPQERHRMGVVGGRATGGVSRAAYGAMLSAAIRRHVPATSSLGEGSASCSFHVSAGGGMTGINCSGSSGAHASLLRSAVAATHAPPPPGGSFFAAQSVHFH